MSLEWQWQARNGGKAGFLAGMWACGHWVRVSSAWGSGLPHGTPFRDSPESKTGGNGEPARCHFAEWSAEDDGYLFLPTLKPGSEEQKIHRG